MLKANDFDTDDSMKDIKYDDIKSDNSDSRDGKDDCAHHCKNNIQDQI